MPTYTSDACQVGIQPKGLRVGLVARSSVYSLSTSISIGTIILMVKVPAGATPVYVSYGTNIAVGISWSVGDGINTARYKTDATTTLAQGMIVNSIVAAPYTYSTDDTIDVYCSIISAQTLAGAFYVNAIFSMDSMTPI